MTALTPEQEAEVAQIAMRVARAMLIRAVMGDSPTVLDSQLAVDALNLAFQEDPVAMRALMINVVPCNAALAQHPTIQTASIEGGYTVGVLGLLNGLLEALGLRCIASRWGGEADSRGSFQLLGFCLYEEEQKEKHG